MFKNFKFKKVNIFTLNKLYIFLDFFLEFFRKVNNIMINFKHIYQSIICEGGASQHMQHLYEDPDLTFKQLKEILTKIFTGQISIAEKTDGQALAITYKDEEVKAARNKATLKDPMTIAEVEKKFEGRGEIKNAFVKSMQDISKAIESLSDEEKNKIFDNGHNFMAFEIIYPPTKNVIDYGNRCLIQLHGVNIYDDKFNKISEDKKLANLLYNVLKQKNALHQSTFEISKDAILKLKNSKDGEESLKIILDKLSQIVDGLGWNATINDYAQERFEKYIVNVAMKSNFDINRNSDFTKKLAERLSSLSKKRPTKNDLAVYAKAEGLNPKDESFKNFVNLLDNTSDEANQLVIKPLEDLIVQAGLMIMKNLIGYISTDPQASAKKLAVELNDTIKELQSKETTLDASKLKRFKKNLAKIDEYQRELTGVEGIVFMYKGKVYKMTSTFSQLNQLLGILKY